MTMGVLTQQALMASPVVARLSSHSRSSMMPLTARKLLALPVSQRKSSVLQVRCTKEEENAPSEMKTEGVSSTSSPPPPPPRVDPLPSKPKVSTKFSDVFAFSGPAPERINGRLAMIGFVAAMAVEVAKGSDVFTQISDGGTVWFVGTSVVLSLASLIPLFKGVRAETKNEGLMNSDAELWNGRLAMLGLVALAFTEYVKGGALV